MDKWRLTHFCPTLHQGWSKTWAIIVFSDSCWLSWTASESWCNIWPLKCDGGAFSCVGRCSLSMECNLVTLSTVIVALSTLSPVNVALSTLSTLITLVAGGVGFGKPGCNLRGDAGGHHHQGEVEDQVHLWETLHSSSFPFLLLMFFVFSADV